MAAGLLQVWAGEGNEATRREAKMTALLVILTIVIAVGMDVAVMAYRRRHGTVPAAVAPRAMLEPRPPQGVFVDPAHSWVRITTEGTLRVGIDEFLVEALGEVEAVHAPARGTRVRRGDPLITLRIGGRNLVVPSPANGEVMTTNDHVVASPYLLARDPYGVGWVVGLWTPDHQEAIRPLRIGAAAVGFLRSEMRRLVDFLNGVALPQSAAVLADGGVPVHGVIRSLDGNGWQAFQDEFLRADRTGA
jgi:glycine cleavage system H lipoate-binding protein